MSDYEPLPDILTVDDIARYLRVSRTTVCRWCSTGTLPAFRLGRSWRVRRCDFELHIEQARDWMDPQKPVDGASS